VAGKRQVLPGGEWSDGTNIVWVTQSISRKMGLKEEKLK
jgi:hypothetical protein